MKMVKKINLDPEGKETFEFSYEEEYDMFTFIYSSVDPDSEELMEIKTELGSLESKAIMEALIFHVLSEEGLTTKDFIERYLLRNKFRGNYEQ